MELIKSKSEIADIIITSYKSSVMNVLDLGCSGGPDQIFTQLKESFELNWIGLDFNKDEIERLKLQYPAKSFTFFLNKLVSHRNNPIEDNVWSLFSAGAASEKIYLENLSQKEIVDNNLWNSKKVKKSESSITVKELLSQTCDNFDLLKIDLDGEDFSFLLDFFDFSSIDPKFVVIECNFYGGASVDSTSFCNQDKFLKKKGYTLGGITPRTYSLKELPGEFIYSIYAQTNFGIPYQADCLYFKLPEKSCDINSLLVYITLFECFNLPDHSAKLILENPELLDPLLMKKLLDKLTTGVWGERFESYEHMIRTFSEDSDQFFKRPKIEGSKLVKPGKNYSLLRLLNKFKNLLK